MFIQVVSIMRPLLRDIYIGTSTVFATLKLVENESFKVSFQTFRKAFIKISYLCKLMNQIFSKSSFKESALAAI